jgi:phospholipid/cholesterol/gamma-HCH transport system substrate-binding protein
MNSAKVVGAGAFVIVGALLFTVALFMIGERRMLFQQRYFIYTEFSSLGQLESGAVVRVAGLDAGEVTEIRIPAKPSERFRVKMEIREDLRQLVRSDSKASTQTEGLVGAIYVNVSAGTDDAPIVAEGGTVPGQDPFQISDLLAQASSSVKLITDTVEALRGDAERAVKQIALVAEDSHGMIEDIRPDITAIARNGNEIAAQTREILTSINEGRGTIGKLVNDDGLYREVRQIASQAQAVMVNVREVSDEARRAIADFRSPAGPTQGLMQDMRMTLSHAREATADLADNMEALKRNFLVRGFFTKRGYFDLDTISPADYQKGVLENGKRKAMRIWLSHGVLFETREDGSELLTADGKARVDSAMATYLRHLPANPLVIEGYSTSGSVGDRFQRARARAAAVRDYVLNRYELMPQHTGFIALGDEAPGSPSGKSWDGVSVTLFLDREALQFVTQPAAKSSLTSSTAVPAPELAPLLER